MNEPYSSMTMKKNKILEDIRGYQQRADSLQKTVVRFIQQGGENYKRFSAKLFQEAKEIK